MAGSADARSKSSPAPELGSGIESVEAAVREFKRQEADVIVLVYGAFTGDDVASYLAEMVQIPIILWAPYEVPFEREDRLYSNALCSMTMNAAALRRLGVSCHTIYGSRKMIRQREKVKIFFLLTEWLSL